MVEKKKAATAVDKKQSVLIYLKPEGLKELKHLGVDEDRSVSDLVAEAVNKLLEKKGRKPLA